MTKLPQDKWQADVTGKEIRKIRARREKRRSIWFGLGTFGMVGWSVVIPTLIGLFIGIWIDNTWPGRYSWTLMLFMGGLAFGLYNAWRWIQFESGLIDGKEEKDEKKDGQ
jgi:ATP synthase protein I